jgi:phosphate:Na+ symporter
MLQLIIQVAGSLGLFLFGMRVMSEGIQKAAGERLQAILKFMTGNRFAAIATGFLITTMVQSSSASTVMVVGFVNAHLLNLTQAIGVILGANIGTTITGWLVALFGFKVNIAAASFPAMGLGALFLFVKKFNKQDWGEALLGFGMLFLGLMFLKDAIPDIKQHPEALEFLVGFTGYGFFSLLLFIAVGAVLTFILQSSSAAMAVTLTMAYSGWIDYPTAAAVILGENIGTTATAYLASLGTDVSARRAARAHLMFNLIGVFWMLFVFKPFLFVVDWLVPGELIATGNTKLFPMHLAVFHSLFNVVNTLVFVGWVPAFARLIERLVPEPIQKSVRGYSLAYLVPHVTKNPELHMLQVKDEVTGMANLTLEMYRKVMAVLESEEPPSIALMNDLKKTEDLTDKMEEEISSVLVAASSDALNYAGVTQVSVMMRIINELERVADSCYNLTLLCERKHHKEIQFLPEAQMELTQYAQQVLVFLEYIHDHFLCRLEGEALDYAFELERGIDQGRNLLKKQAQRRLKKKTSSIKTELLYIDMVNQIEHIGDFSLTIARSQRELPKSHDSTTRTTRFRTNRPDIGSSSAEKSAHEGVKMEKNPAVSKRSIEKSSGNEGVSNRSFAESALNVEASDGGDGATSEVAVLGASGVVLSAEKSSGEGGGSPGARSIQAGQADQAGQASQANQAGQASQEQDAVSHPESTQ